jgi:glycosyltransferase involved in cell wall biosynthesis
MRIVFLGDTSHPNAQSWIRALEATTACTISTWSLPSGHGPMRRVIRVLAWVGAVLRIRTVVSERSPDLLIAYRTTSYGFLGALSGFHPLVVAAQGETDVWPVDSIFISVKRWMARFCLRKADLIHAWGEHMAQDQIALGAARDKILVRPRGVDLTRFFPPSDVERDQLRMVCTRSLFPEYRHDLILDALAGLVRRGVPASLDLVGDGSRAADLKDQAVRLGIADRVRFHGRVDHERLPDLLRTCNVYVAMPTTEGVSASLLEAMACGCYPVVSDLTANRHWIVHGENGRLVKVDDGAALEDALMGVWSNLRDVGPALAQNRSLVETRASQQDNMACFLQRYRLLAANGSAQR